MKKLSPFWLKATILLTILAGNFLLKTLELFDLVSQGGRLQFYFPLRSYMNEPWKLLLPVNVGENFSRWSTTGLVISSIPQLFNVTSGPYITLYAFNALLIVATFLTSWYLSESNIFTVTMSLCMAFGTQFNGLYGNYSIVILYLLIAYIQINIVFLFLILKEQGSRNRWLVGFVISLITAALCWETWLDYAVCLSFLFSFLYVVFKKKGDVSATKKLKTLSCIVVSVVLIYIVVKSRYAGGMSEHFTHGKEDETIFSYLLESPKYWCLALEDFLSNVMTYSFIAFSNFVPSFLLSSNSLDWLGTQILALQYGYDYKFSSLVYFHHLFLWYYSAGAIFAVFFYYLIKYLKRSLRRPFSSEDLIMFSILLLILTGSFTHTLIKYRPYLSVPLLAYKCAISILGTSYLFSFILMKLQQTQTRRTFFFMAGAVWLLIIYGGFTRNVRLSHLGAQVMPGSNYSRIPNPLRY